MSFLIEALKYTKDFSWENRLTQIMSACYNNSNSFRKIMNKIVFNISNSHGQMETQLLTRGQSRIDAKIFGPNDLVASIECKIEHKVTAGQLSKHKKDKSTIRVLILKTPINSKLQGDWKIIYWDRLASIFNQHAEDFYVREFLAYLKEIGLMRKQTITKKELSKVSSFIHILRTKPDPSFALDGEGKVFSLMLGVNEKKLYFFDLGNSPLVNLDFNKNKKKSLSLDQCDFITSHGGHEHNKKKLVELNKNAKAHREHIVPISLISPLYPELKNKRNHGKKHIVNSIGNLTFISEDFNEEHKNIPVEIWKISDRSLLTPHFLNDESVIENYKETICNLEGEGVPKEKARRFFEDFTKSRIEHISKAMINWINELSFSEEIINNIDIEPVPLIIKPSSEDKIREKKWNKEVKKTILCLIKEVHLNSEKRWILKSCGKGKEKKHISNCIYVSEGCDKLHIGKNIRASLSQEVIKFIHSTLGLEYGPGNDQLKNLSFKLDPNDLSTAIILRCILDYLNLAA